MPFSKRSIVIGQSVEHIPKYTYFRSTNQVTLNAHRVFFEFFRAMPTSIVFARETLFYNKTKNFFEKATKLDFAVLKRKIMSYRVVPEIKTTRFGECSINNFEIGPDDIDWCTGFWNEMAGDVIPSLYPDSPIFSSKEFDWDDPVFLENVFETPNVEETFAGTHLNGYPGFVENQKNEDIFSACSSKGSEPDSILQVGPSSNASKQKYKRPRKPKTENAQDTPSKRQRTNSAKKTKPKTKK